MNWIVQSLQQVYGLFVDDSAQSLLICVWLALASLALPAILSSPQARALVLLAGLLTIFLDSVRRGAVSSR